MGEKEIEKVEEVNSEVIEEVKTADAEVVEDTRKGLSITALVLGICSIVFCKYIFISVACGVLAVIFGLKGKKRGGKGMAAAGFITGIIGLSLEALLFILGLILGLALIGSLSTLML